MIRWEMFGKYVSVSIFCQSWFLHYWNRLGQVVLLSAFFFYYFIHYCFQVGYDLILLSFKASLYVLTGLSNIALSGEVSDTCFLKILVIA